jgi:hypothetical protein
MLKLTFINGDSTARPPPGRSPAMLTRASYRQEPGRDVTLVAAAAPAVDRHPVERVVTQR